MAISFVAAGAEAGITAAGGGGTASIPAPAGLASGDIVVLVVAMGNAVDTYTPPSGFTRIDTVAPGGFNAGMYIDYKIAGGSEPANYDVSHTSNATGVGKA